MVSRALDLLALLWPVVLGSICLVISMFPQAALEKTGVLRLSFLEYISLEQSLGRGLVRLIFFLGAVFLFVIPAFRDYSRFFPEALKVTVFFDDQGIEKFLESSPKNDLRHLSIAPDWKQRKKAYFEHINSELQKADVPFRFREIPGQTSATGEVKFRTRMIDRWGAQLYQIADAKGSLVHTTEMPGVERYRIVSEFELLETRGAIVNGSIADIYFDHGVLIMPEFKQLFRISPTKEVYHHALIAATRVDVFPYINISNTLYLVRQDNGTNVPIGYGMYGLP